MLEKSFALLYYLKQPKTENKKGHYVYLRITVDGKSKELSTKRLWSTDKWNQALGRATGNKEDARSLNGYLDSLIAKVYEARKTLLDSDRKITAIILKGMITGSGPERRTILKVFDKHNEGIEELIGDGYKPRTLQRYQTARNHLKNFITFKLQSGAPDNDDMELREINYEFVSDFYQWLRSKKKCAFNSAMKYLSLFKKIIIQCRKKGWIFSDPFAEFKTSPKVKPVVPLTREELERMRTKAFSTDRLNMVRDIFIFSCYTGLAYVDAKQLMRSQIIAGIDGNQWITTNREKNEAPTRVPLLKLALDILNKYADHPKCSQKGYALPVSSNQKINEYLKEIAALCGINRRLTYHIARHTFATTVTLSNNVPIESVSKMLGHSSIKQTQHYAKVIDLKVSEDMEKLEQTLERVNMQKTDNKEVAKVESAVA